MTHVVVVGAGISGLAGALRLRELGGPALRITVLDQADRVGGKLSTGDVGGMRIEQGAEAFLLRDPVMAQLAGRVGLGELVQPAPLGAGLVTDGRIRPMPAGTLMGIPADPGSWAGDAVARPRAEPHGTGGPLLGPGADVSVGALVRSRYGDQVVERLVDPLLGGVYAGRADDLSLAVTLPALHGSAQRESTLAAAVTAAQRATPRPTGPLFGAVRGGMTQLVEALARESGAELRLGLPVRELTPTTDGWQLTVGSTRDPQRVAADAVLLAVPARPAARLLSGFAPDAAAEVGVLDYASVALVTLVLPGDVLPGSSGFLVPATEGYAVKAATFVSRKWPHLAVPDRCAVRLSIGRYRESQVLHRADAELTDLALRELSGILGERLPDPVATAVRRWGGGLPQYGPGHTDRIARARAALAGHPTLTLAGAGYDGVGVPVCARSGQHAAESLIAGLGPAAASVPLGETNNG